MTIEISGKDDGIRLDDGERGEIANGRGWKKDGMNFLIYSRYILRNLKF